VVPICTFLLRRLDRPVVPYASCLFSVVSYGVPAAALQVCYYRDKQSINKFRIITATKAGVKLTEPFALETNWHYKVRVRS
jgi:hypothetical protein